MYTATTEIYTLSLHDALPISLRARAGLPADAAGGAGGCVAPTGGAQSHHRPVSSQESRATRAAASLSADRKSTRLNSSHTVISYAVFCLKKKKKKQKNKLSNK